MHQFTGKVIFLLIMVSFLLGLMVVGVLPKFGVIPEYSIENNIRSNRNYYPSVKVGNVVEDVKDKQEEDAGAQGY